MGVPGKLVYLDCKILGPEEFQLFWGWPPITKARKASSRCKAKSKSLKLQKPITHAVVEYMDEGEWRRIKTKTSPFLFKGMVYYDDISA